MQTKREQIGPKETRSPLLRRADQWDMLDGFERMSGAEFEWLLDRVARPGEDLHP